MSAPKSEPNSAWINAAAVILAALIGAAALIYTSNNKPVVSSSGTQQMPSDQTPHLVDNKLPATKKNPKDGANMILIPAGEFVMGSDKGESDEKPQRTVYLDGYYIYKDLVTGVQYRAFCEATGRAMPPAPSWRWNANDAMVNVTWENADAYCKWAGGHLPTEAQWEKAARGTDGRKYPWGNDWDSSMWHHGTSPYGCMNMTGNIGQLCADWYDKDYYKSAPAHNPTGPTQGTCRVLHGGTSSSKYTAANFFRAAFRRRVDPTYRDEYSGFRVAFGL